jgi:hypothetical protein
MRHLVVRSSSGCSCIRPKEGIPNQPEHAQTRVLANAATEYFRIASDRSRSNRRGSIMTLFAVLLFALLPLMALIVHTGFVTLTRRQMQTAVNTGAIEGLRFRDELSEPDRRQQVSRLVASLFDDDLTPGNGDPMQFGAGPLLDITGGQTLGSSDFRALTTVSVPDDRAWKPELESNTGDDRHGDQVAGNYVYDVTDPDHDSHEESSDYSREDFEPQAGGDSFLVRLRRTRLPDGTAPPLDDVLNVSSTGPTIPFLFGRVPYGNADGGTSLLNQRERGTVVRATAIAKASPALTVGTWSSDVGVGAAPIWVEQTQWDGLDDGVAENVTISGATLLDTGMLLFGTFDDRPVVAVGDTLESVPPGAAVSVMGERYVPVYRVLTSGNRYVVGFGLADFSIDQSAGGTITRITSRIGEGNCSAHWRANLSAVPAADLIELLANRNSQHQPLLAPALVRAIE